MASHGLPADNWLSTDKLLRGKKKRMASLAEPVTGQESKKRNLVEMNWDPITRIVGSLGIFTKIDFENKEVVALSALFVGLLYDGTALDGAWDLVKDWSASDRQALRDAVPREGLSAQVQGKTVHLLARNVVELAASGLAARARADATGADERQYLAPLEALLSQGKTQADVLLDRYRGAWNGQVEPVFSECTF